MSLKSLLQKIRSHVQQTKNVFKKARVQKAGFSTYTLAIQPATPQNVRVRIT